MKKVLFIGMALLSMAAVSCSLKEVAFEEAPNGRNVVTLGASVDMTKAAISDAGAFTWQEGDALSVQVGEGLVGFTLTDGAGQKTATFSAELNPGSELGSIAIYPAGAHKVVGDVVTFNLPASYDFEEDNTNIPLVGAVANGKVKFAAVGGVARFKAGIPVGAEKVVLATDKKITGDFEVAEGIISAGEGADEVTYNLGTVTADKNMTFNFPLPVGEYTMTFKILGAGDQVIAELPGSAPHAISAADVLVFDELSFDEPINFSITKVWGRYSATDLAWYEKMAGIAAGSDEYRCATMDDNYVYMPRQNGGSEAVIYYFPIDDPEDIKTLPATSITKTGTHIVACARIAPSASGSKLLVGNLTVGNSKFDVWKWDNVNSEPVNVLSYDAPDGCRLGDKFDFQGTWEDGEILALNGYESGRVWIFKVKNGVVNPEPVRTDFLGGSGNNFGSVYPWFDSNEYVKLGHNPAQPAMLYTREGDTFTAEGNIIFDYDGDKAAMKSYEKYPIKNVAHGFRTFEINGKAYAAYVANYDWNYETVLRIFEVDKTKTMLESLAEFTPDKCLSVSLSNAEGTLGVRAPYQAGNGSADLTVRKINGVTYLLAQGPNIGTALFKMDEVESGEEPGTELLTRVWAKSYVIDDSWDDALEPARSDWNRNATICGSYIYIPVVNNKTVGIFDLQGNYVSTITGFTGAGTFGADAIATLGNAVYVSSCSINEDLTIYKLTGKDDTGKFTSFEIVAQYARSDMPQGARYGDRMTAFGSDKEGVLMFVDYAKNNGGGDGCRSNLQFAVKNGVVNPVPVKAQSLETKEGIGMQGIFILDGGPDKTQYALYAGNQVDTRSISLGGWLSDQGWNKISEAALPAFTTNVNDPRVFNAGGKDYLAYVVASSGSAGVLAYLTVVEIPAGNGNIVQRIGEIEDIDAVATKYGLVDPEDIEVRAGAGASNGTGYCEISYVNGEAYIMAGADAAGLSLFKINGATIPEAAPDPDPQPENLAITPEGVGSIEGTTATVSPDNYSYPSEPIKLTYTLAGSPVEKTISGVAHVTLKNVPKETKYVFFEIYPTGDEYKFLIGSATADITAEAPALAGSGLDYVFVPVSLEADGDLELNIPLLTGTFQATNLKADLFTGTAWTEEVPGCDKLEKPFEATTIEPGDVLDFVFEWPGAEPMNVFIGNDGYATIQEAVDAAQAGQTITVNEGTFDEDVLIEKAITLQGAGAGTVVTSVEIFKAAATVKDLTVKVKADAMGAVHPHEGYGAYTFGIYISEAGYGAVVDNVTIDMSGAKSDATGLFMFSSGTNGTVRDVVKNSTFAGVASKRNAQIYSAFVELKDNVINAGHRDYGIRIGNGNSDIVLSGNTFNTRTEGGKGFAVDFLDLNNSKVVLGDGVTDDNSHDGSFASLYGSTKGENFQFGTNQFTPALSYDSATGILAPAQQEDGIIIDGNMSDWESIPALTSTGTSRIRSWKFASDDSNLYFNFVLRKNRMRTAYNLSLGFSWDDSGSYTADNLSGLECVILIQPFTNSDQGTPICVNGTIGTATINGSEATGLSIQAYGNDPDPNATGDTADYYLEVSIPRSILPNLPTSGTIQIGAGYEWYKTDLQEVTL